MSYSIHPELKRLSANLKRFDMGDYFFSKDFRLTLEENGLDDFWNQVKEIRRQNEKIVFLKVDFSEYTEIFVIGLDLICREYYNNNITFEEASEDFSIFFRICFSYYILNTNRENDYSTVIAILEENDFIDKIVLNDIKELIAKKKINLKMNNENIEIDRIVQEKNIENRKYQIFISSTFTDLIEERQACVQAILKKGHIPAGMELFTAGDKSQWEVIKKWIDESDIYLLILGGRYGSIDKETGTSYTEMEYNYAVEKRKPIFSLVLTNNILDKKPTEIIKDYDHKNPKYISFKENVKSKMCSFPENVDQIKTEVNHSLDNLILEYKHVMKGWIKGN